MREILFRGKQIENGQWKYGSFIPDLREVYYGGCSVGFIKPFSTTAEGRIMVEVDRETVGQYSGIVDKNGTRIFEGDIVQYLDEDYGGDDFDCQSIVMFGEYKQDGSDGEYGPSICNGWYVRVDNFTCPEWTDDPNQFRKYHNERNLAEIAGRFEIIGNIHEKKGVLE